MIADALYPYDPGLVVATEGGMTCPARGRWTPNAHQRRTTNRMRTVSPHGVSCPGAGPTASDPHLGAPVPSNCEPMPRRLRVFVSSTMLDLRNERRAVRNRLLEFNFEPVNAEDMTPNGMASWTRINAELEECDVMILLLGDSYGWVPTSGPDAGADKSVTRLEFERARELGLPVLSFIRNDFSANTAKERRRREDFRRLIEDWETGVFRATFNLADDLAEEVGRAMIELLSGHFLHSERASRTPQIDRPASHAPVAWIPDQLRRAVSDRRAVPVVGGAMSAFAGLPSGAAVASAMRQRLDALDPDYRPPTAGSPFYAIAADLEALEGPVGLQRVFSSLIGPSVFAGTTDTHRKIMSLSDLVVTTTIDDLLERADPTRPIVTACTATMPSARDVALIKLHGRLAEPESLVMTEGHLAGPSPAHTRLIAAVASILSARPILALGSSMRDPRLLAVLEEAGSSVRGWVVGASFSRAERVRLERHGLTPVEGDPASVVDELVGH